MKKSHITTNQLLELIRDEPFNHMGTELQFGYVMLAIGFTLYKKSEVSSIKILTEDRQY